MSGHAHERLSAYLDGELPAQERAAVSAHLAACAECSARLAELAAVDEAAGALPAEAPPGYFDALPARVRARVEALSPRRQQRRLPVWTWAAAAALLLAVLTPLTLRQRPAPLAPPPATSPPPEAAGAVAVAPGPQDVSRDRPVSGEAKQEQLRATPSRPAPQAAPELAKTTRPSEGFASSPLEPATTTAAEPAWRGAPTPLAVRTPAAPGAVAAGEAASADEAGPARQRGDAGTGGQASAVEEEARAVEPGAVGVPAATEVQAMAAEPGRAATREKAPADVQAGSQEPAENRAAALRDAPAAGRMLARKGGGLEEEFRRLDRERPRSAAEWRRLREDWRTFTGAQPEGPHADEARVRTIEAGYEAWRAGSEPADGALFRRDASAYLERDDAAQKERVRALVASAGPP